MKKSFLEMVREKYGNPRARFCDGHLPVGRRVSVILSGEILGLNKVVEGVVWTPRKKMGKGKVIVRMVVGGRKRIVPIDRERILTAW